MYSYFWYGHIHKPSSKELYREYTENRTKRTVKPFLYKDPIYEGIRTHRCRNPDTGC